MARTFVDRIEELRTLNKALKYDGQESPVFVFTGIGGMGKTALRIAFEEQLLKPKKIPYAVLDYDGDPNLRPIEASLRAIRRQLGRHKVKTPVFDFLYGRYFELSMGVKLSAQSFPPELEGVVNILEGIPFVGNVTQILHGLSQLGLVAQERLQHKEWLYRIRDLEPRDILNLLPEVLAGDLEEAMSLQTSQIIESSGCRIVLLLDAYELISESQLDDTLHRKLLLLTPHLLRVVFTRIPLPWEHKFANEWQGKITHFPSLDDLPYEDAMIFLKKKSIDSADLGEYLYQLTGGYPLHLELCADICREIEETNKRKPGLSDFQGAAQAKDLTEELVRRLLRQLKANERDLMCLAVYPRWLSEEVLEVLSSVPESVPRIFQKFTSLSMFSPHAEIPGAYVIRKEVRDCLLTQQHKERLWKQWHGKLAKFHTECWDTAHSHHHLGEALYHRFYENSDEAIKMFEEHFWKVLDEFRFAEAEALLGAVAMETLDEKQKRKIYYGRARVLTATAHSRQSLTTAEKLYESIINSETDEGVLGTYLFYFGEILCDLAEYRRALEYLEKGLAIRLKIYGEKHTDVADSYHSIGFVYMDIGKCAEALQYFQKSLEIRLMLYGEEHSKVASTYINIGNVFHYLDKYENALEYYRKSLAIFLKVYGEKHPKVAAVYNNIGYVNTIQGEYEKALEYYQKSITILVKIYGEEHLSLAPSYLNSGIVYLELGDYQNALEYYQKSLAIWLKVYGEEHPYIATAYNSIGNVYSGQDEYDKALEYYQQGLSIGLKAYGEEHVAVAHSYGSIGNIHVKRAEYKEALEYYNKTLTILLKVCGAEHHDVAETYGNFGIMYREQAEYRKALEYYEKALAVFQKVHGAEHPSIANTYSEIAQTLWGMKIEEEAFEKMQQSVGMYRKFKHWRDAVECLETLTGWLDEKGKNREAEEARTEVQKIRKEHVS